MRYIILFVLTCIPFSCFFQEENKLELSVSCNNINSGKPNRTFVGSKWVKGFSDHLPIYCQIKRPDIFTMFYNVENLFDTIDNTSKNDNDFLPNSDKKWNTEKYKHKLNQLEKVFSAINSKEIPNIIGLCEVENKLVIDDLLNQPFFENHTFQIIHQESPDSRGIDCAILFDKKFKLIRHDFIEIKIPGFERPTRDIVYAKLQINNETLNVFVNHWPSRWGGTNETEPKRIYAANVLKNYIEKNLDDSEKILIMGDFNDYPSNKSITQYLEKTKKIKLTNLMADLPIGSYNYKGEWGWLDHIIVSSNLIKNNNKMQVIESDAFVEDWMLFEPKRCKRRTYCKNEKCSSHGGNCY